MRTAREWKKLYGGDKCTGLTSESALFVCNKWDDVERQTKTNPLAQKKIKMKSSANLRRKSLNLSRNPR